MQLSMVHRAKLGIASLKIQVNDSLVRHTVKNQLYESDYIDITTYLRPGGNNIFIIPKNIQNYSLYQVAVLGK